MFYYRIKASEKYTNLLLGDNTVVIGRDWSPSEIVLDDPRIEPRDDNPVFIPAPQNNYGSGPITPETPSIVIGE